MMVLSLAAAVAAISLAVLVAFLIPTVVELRRTIRTLRGFIQETETKIEPALDEVREVLADLKVVTDATASKADEVKAIMSALGDTGESIHRINGVINSAVGIIRKPASYLAGAKAAGKHILEKIKKKGG